MATIKSIHVKGFKAFAKRTDLFFENGFNCIIGPNGSGKSNVMDAICFVLGKSSAKGLRAERASALIFDGGKAKTPAREAEVSIIFDNKSKEFPLSTDEIKVTRLLKSSGQSVYKLNDEVLTRQQVVEALRKAKIDPDGHNVILQGEITRIAKMKPVEIREILEEVSGISVYEEKKKKALSELEKVKTKMKEAEIVLNERGAYLRELKKDRDQALKQKDLEEKIKSNKATLIHLNIKEKNNKIEEINKKINNHEKEYQVIEEKIKNHSEEIDNLRKELKEINEIINKKGEKEQIELHNNIDLLKENIIKEETKVESLRNNVSQTEQRVPQLKNEQKELSSKISNLEKNKEELSKKLEKLNQDGKNIEKTLKNFKEENNLGDSMSNLESIDKKIDELQTELNQIREKKQELIIKKENITLNLNHINEQIQKIDSRKKEDESNIKELKNNKESFKKTISNLDKFEKSYESLKNKIHNLRTSLVEKNEKLAKLKVRNISASERISANLALKKIKEMKKGIIGTISELGKTKSEYSQALEVAAGPRINSVVVENDAVASKCISYLKQNKLGIVTFLPLNKMRKAAINPNIKNMVGKNGVKGMAIDLISFDSKLKDVFFYVFGNTLVVDNLDNARKNGIGTARMVTLDGDIVETSGAMVGGFRRKNFGSSFSAKDIEQDIKKFEKDISQIRTTIDNYEDEKIQTEKELFSLKEKKAFLEVQIKSLESSTSSVTDYSKIKQEKSQLESQFKLINTALSNLDKDINSIAGKIDTQKSTKEAIMKSSTNIKIVNHLADLENNKKNITENIIKIYGEIKNTDMQIQSVLSPEVNKIDSIIKNHEQDISKTKKTVSTLLNEIKTKKQELKSKESEEKKLASNFKGLFDKRNKFSEKINSKENNIIREQDKTKYIRERINSLNIDRARNIAEKEGFEKEFEDFTDIKTRRGMQIPDLKYEIRKFESQIRNLGNVNMRALEIYEKVSEEYQKITEKHETLQDEKNEVISMIEEIDSKKHNIFMKTFKSVHENFKRVFANLNPTKTAHLELEDKDNVFNGGVGINVKKAGNKVTSVHSLSGGEQTMTALSFLLAIQEHCPSAFYLLDEVDAALDKNNSGILSKLIQQYSKKSQYIVISHNDSVIPEADTLYGVSQQEGVSKVVSIKI